MVASASIAMGAFTLVKLAQVQDAGRNEIVARARQNCILFERFHHLTLEQLDGTRKYLRAIRPDERDQTINRFVRQGLPALEARAKIDAPPAYCKRLMHRPH